MPQAKRRNSRRQQRRVNWKALSREMALSLGREVLAARPPQISWKALEDRYGLCRARLVQLRQEALCQSGDET